MSEFDSANSGSDLIPGDAGALEGLANQLIHLAEGLLDAASTIRRIGPEGWSGMAESSFSKAMKAQPTQYEHAATAFRLAGYSLKKYAEALQLAQNVGTSAIHTYSVGMAATVGWAAASTFSDSPSTPDPGAAERDTAESSLAGALSSIDGAAISLIAAFKEAASMAPHQAGPFGQIFGDVDHGLSSIILSKNDFVVFMENVGQDSIETGKGTVAFAEGAAKLDPYAIALIGPQAYFHHVENVATGVYEIGRHPLRFSENVAANLVDVKDLENHHWNKALAKIFTGAAFIVITGGGVEVSTAGPTEAALGADAITDGSADAISSGEAGRTGMSQAQDGIANLGSVPIRPKQAMLDGLSDQMNAVLKDQGESALPVVGQAKDLRDLRDGLTAIRNISHNGYATAADLKQITAAATAASDVSGQADPEMTRSVQKLSNLEKIVLPLQR